MTGWETTPRFGTPLDAVKLQATYVVVEDTGLANDPHSIRHNLGRVPQGVRVIRAETLSTDHCVPYQSPGDQWDDLVIVLRFLAQGARVKLEIF